MAPKAIPAKRAAPKHAATSGKNRGSGSGGGGGGFGASGNTVQNTAVPAQAPVAVDVTMASTQPVPSTPDMASIIIAAASTPEVASTEESFFLPLELLLLISSSIHLLIQNHNIHRLNFYHYTLHSLIFSIVMLLRRFLSKLALRAAQRDMTEGRRLMALLQKTNEAGDEVSSSLVLDARELNINRKFRFLFFGLLYCWLFLLCGHCGVKLLSHYPLWNAACAGYPTLVSYLFLRTPKSSNLDVHAAGRLQLRHLAASTAAVTYYAAFLPLQFAAPEHMYYNAWRCRLFVVLVLASTLALLALQLLREELAASVARAHRLGGWARQPWWAISGSRIEQWDPAVTYQIGACVHYHGRYYKAVSSVATATPGNLIDRLYWWLFRCADQPFRLLVGLQCGVLGALLVLVLRSRQWAAYALLLVFNYVVLWLVLALRRACVASAAAVGVSSPPPPS
eukprot:TRINITY_DN9418_c0_g1_i1.p1 TRINITY_DN9418_c0_g1~~TRINITY_DN9418_c0_g1_i1.p1  ORF type:complete len:468 (+),score=92.32 TRINITY_DN9418_c0_g1_i1:51-1406(+)